MKRKVFLFALWIVIGVGIAIMFISAISCTSAQIKERQLTSKVVEQTLGNTVTTTTQLTETTKVDTTISPDLPLPGVDGGGILGMILSVLPAGGIGGVLLAIWQFLRARGFKQIATVQTEAIENLPEVQAKEVKAAVRAEAVDTGVQTALHRFVKKVTE